MNNLKDIAYLEMAYSLAQKAKGWASPNPLVGAVVVNSRDAIVGYGYHEGPGKPHAEAIALQRAGARAKNSTAYITLEPCIHWGRTPPCLDSLLQSGLKRVVVSDFDPNPVIHMKGIKKMKEAGLEVSLGLLREKNRLMNEAYIKYVTNKMPFIQVKAAVSLDGRMATKEFDSQWISSSQARDYAQLLRGEYDAIMVGINTLIKDDPLLTVRHPGWKGKKITRVILDSRLRFPLQARILQTLDKGKILVFTLGQASPNKAYALLNKGVEVISLPVSSSRLDLKEVLRLLAKKEISSVLVEGGGRLLTTLIEEKLADKILLILAPLLIGGAKAPSFFQGQGFVRIRDSLRLKKMRAFTAGDDLLLEGYF